MSFYEAWWYLMEHKIFNEQFVMRCLDIDVVNVNAETLERDDDPEHDRITQVWLECGPYDKEWITHDPNLDCGANTFEEAIIMLAQLVKENYDK